MALPEYRVQLIDPTSQEKVTDVDVLTNSSAVIYENDKPTVEDFRGIPKGTKFLAEGDNGERLSKIIDNILYPHINPKIIKFDMGLLTDITENETESIEFNDWKNQFFASLNIQVGSESSLELTVKRYDINTGVVSSDVTTVTVTPGSIYQFQPAIARIDRDTRICISIYDGISTVETPSVTYTVRLPIFVGLCDLSEVLDDNNLIDNDKAISYFQSLIRNSDGLVSKLVTPIKNIDGISSINPVYASKRKHPFVLYPNTWNKPFSITDTNEDNIIGSFLYNSNLSIKPNSKGNSTQQYSVYICKNSFYCNLSILNDISYNFEYGKSQIDYNENGIPNIAGFDILCNIPSDWRTIVDEYSDLDSMKYPYDGLITYVKSEHSFFQYTSDGTWTPTNQQVHITATGKAPSVDIGSWNDICIDLKSNIFFQKYRNIRWEEKGRIIGGSLILKYVESTIYKTDDLVIYNNIVYRALRDGIVNIAPDSDITAWEETEVSGGIPGPAGPAGDAATVEIVGTETVDDVEDAVVVNLGDKHNARLLFKIPGGDAIRGPKGDQGEKGEKGDTGANGRAATVQLGTVTPGNRFTVTNVGTINDAILNITYPEALDYFNNGGALYPEGSIFQTVNPDFHPNGILPGKWEYIGTASATDESGISTTLRIFRNIGGNE